VQKNRLYYLYRKIIPSLLLLNISLFASGAYDKGTSTGKGRLEFSITINPFKIIPYGQNYGVLSYGLTKSFDIVAYYSKHRNGTESQYVGGLYQFLNHKKIDLSTAFGLRYTKNNKWDIFFPQLLFSYKLPKDFSIGGSFVKVIQLESKEIKGDAIDITLYSPIKNIKKLNKKIHKAYFGLGVFKNTESSLKAGELYLHYSLDIIF